MAFDVKQGEITRPSIPTKWEISQVIIDFKKNDTSTFRASVNGVNSIGNYTDDIAVKSGNLSSDDVNTLLSLLENILKDQ